MNVMVKVIKLSEMGTPYNGFQSIQVIATSQFVPYVSYVDKPARVILYVTLDGEDMEVTVNADRSCAHDGSKKRYFPFHARQKGAVIVDGHQRVQVLHILQPRKTMAWSIWHYP